MMTHSSLIKDEKSFRKFYDFFVLNGQEKFFFVAFVFLNFLFTPGAMQRQFVGKVT